MLISINRYDKKPIYEQVVEQLKNLILTDILKADDELPSVRNLSVQLSVNPNTLQKAYTELERQGICHTVLGNGRYVTPSAKENILKMQNELIELLFDTIQKLLLHGLTIDDIIGKISNIQLKN